MTIMTSQFPGPSIGLVDKTEKPKKLELCIRCQNVKDVKGDTQLTSTAEGHEKIIKASSVLEGSVSTGISDDLAKFSYHLKTCYARYKRDGERKEIQVEDQESDKSPHYSQSPEICSPLSQAKRRKTLDNLPPKEKPCIICNCKHKEIIDRYRICDKNRAKTFIKAFNFNKDDVYTRCVFYKNEKDIFTADNNICSEDVFFVFVS